MARCRDIPKMQFASHFTAIGERLTGETFSKFRAVLRLSTLFGNALTTYSPICVGCFFFSHTRKQVVLGVELQGADL
jgi:hypothetical protein